MPQWGQFHLKLEQPLGTSSLEGLPWFQQLQSMPPDFTDVSLVLWALKRLLECLWLFLFLQFPLGREGLGFACPWHSQCSPSFALASLVDLLALLKWKAFPDRIMDILGRLRHVSGEEIVKVWLLEIHTCCLTKNLGRSPYISLISTGTPLRPCLEIQLE